MWSILQSKSAPFFLCKESGVILLNQTIVLPILKKNMLEQLLQIIVIYVCNMKN